MTFKAVLAAAGVAIGIAACGGGTTAKQAATPRAHAAHAAPAAHPAAYQGPELQHPAPAPPLVGRDYLGGSVDLAADRGHAVLLTFIYTHCPDVCPLIVSNLHNALAQLGSRAREVRIIAVSTDPKGDTPRAVATFLARRGMAGRMQYVVGSPSELIPIWRRWGISTSNPTAEDQVNHTALIYGITASGKVTTVYPSNFAARGIAHDVPLLAST
jgi:protein SCO1/2